MATKTQFADLLRDIEPSPTTKSRASAAHTELRAFVRGHEDFEEHHIDDFLSGSYRRDTSIRPRIKDGQTERGDVDIIVVTNHTRADDPADVLIALFEVLSEDYETIRLQQRSVGLQTWRADMDVVPIIAPAGMTGTLYIPDHKLKDWLPTNPPGHTVWTTEINADTGGRFKPLVKLFKWWRRLNPTGAADNKRPKGFVVECMVAENMSRSDLSYEELFLSTLEAIYAKYSVHANYGRLPHIDDPGVPGSSVIAGMELADFKSFLAKVKAHADLGRQAQRETDDEKALELWRQIFGSRFPAAGRPVNASLLNSAVTVSPFSFPNRPVVPNKPQGFA